MSKPFTLPQTEILFTVQRQLRDAGLDPLKQFEYDLYSWHELIFDFDPEHIPVLKKRVLNGKIAIPVVSVEQVISLIIEKMQIKAEL